MRWSDELLSDGEIVNYDEDGAIDALKAQTALLKPEAPPEPSVTHDLWNSTVFVLLCLFSVFLIGKMSKRHFESISAALDKPIKRVGGLILVVGIVLIVIGVIQIGTKTATPGLFWESWVNATFDYRDYDTWREYISATIGPIIALIGFLFSFAYDAGIGKIVSWVKLGN